MSPYIHYRSFEQQVLAHTCAGHYEAHKHLLPCVDISLRERFLYTLERCKNIPESGKWVATGKKLPDAHYYKFIGFMVARL
ncbi:MAG: hypothetical protein BGO70_11045 [Bacteroidetes bacterium 43-93]|nr:hypothetical protein [Bacteroidota bacterium]OJW95650.1 MAG: hypothetical protein BGO70_11045 [Bacteroidetes bacterium 43-93]